MHQGWCGRAFNSLFGIHSVRASLSESLQSLAFNSLFGIQERPMAFLCLILVLAFNSLFGILGTEGGSRQPVVHFQLPFRDSQKTGGAHPQRDVSFQLPFRDSLSEEARALAKEILSTPFSGFGWPSMWKQYRCSLSTPFSGFQDQEGGYQGD